MADSVAGQVQERAADGDRRTGRGGSGARQFFRRLLTEKPLGTVGAVITLLLLLTGIFADVLAPYGFNETEVGDFLQPPSAQFWLGTDNLGRDVLSRVIYGARISMVVGLAATTVSTLISTAIGLLCGYWGGKFDLVVQRFVDGWMCLPYLPILMVVMAIVGPGLLGPDHRYGGVGRHRRLALLAQRGDQHQGELLPGGIRGHWRLHFASPVSPHPAQHPGADHHQFLARRTGRHSG